jgi:hypothetical protein
LRPWTIAAPSLSAPTAVRAFANAASAACTAFAAVSICAGVAADFLEQRSDIRRPVAGNLLANRQHRAVGLHGLDRLGLAGKGPVLRDKHPGAKDDRQDRHRKHRYRKETTDPHVVIPLREGDQRIRDSAKAALMQA